MRNTVQYPVTLDEMIEACEWAAEKMTQQKPINYGDMRPLALRRAAIHLKRLQFAAHEDDE